MLEQWDGENDLGRALQEEQLRLVYQPEIALDSDHIMGVEALLRWDHPGRGVVLPADFIPLAEETDLIVPIGAWVLREACRAAARWQTRRPDRPPLVVSVNVSARQFTFGLVETVREAMAHSSVDPEAICLEVTESVVMEDVDSAIKVLEEIKGLGIKLAIDDFGTGYSSLANLRRFPLDMLKIDRSFVDGLGRDSDATAIVAAIVGMAHALDLRVVAEGVETEEQITRLRTLGCEYVQGYYFARPLPAWDVDQLLEGESAARRLASSMSGAPVGYQKEVVVVADDTPEVLHLARMSLTTAGLEVHEAKNGHEAIELVRRIRPECVLLDVELGDMSGFEVCRVLRADATTRECTILMLTAEYQAAAKVEAFSIGADDYIVKPFAPRDLVSRVRAAVRRRGPFATGNPQAET